ncbi:DUF1269 domain-containing protein [Gordonia desulfuricans]|uniref:DUF1269 domain-containing protein n=1 Tax=Gordonia desulfuricans TaxID=89051 RepID=A0A7K3LV23_9ACTN|nr:MULTISPECIES: DUF6325 family protein [Gordonia]EMP12901.1 hypothetical protein ISGA_952 [Gordonia sp. NB41Y]NDK91781.1 DUF1269 domain-containing protein [Gordonia desulfuricans]WLP92617.1 DUF6325 family protein [Gordonia sp. NB41Y]
MTSGLPSSDAEVDIGPIDYLVIEFPTDARFDGSGLAHLRDVVDRDIIRVLDLAFIRHDGDTVVAIDVADLGIVGDLDAALFAEAATGLIDDEDIAEVGAILEPGHAAAVIVYENHWAAPLASALRRTGAELIAAGRIPVDEVVAALDDLDGG